MKRPDPKEHIRYDCMGVDDKTKIDEQRALCQDSGDLCTRREEWVGRRQEGGSRGVDHILPLEMIECWLHSFSLFVRIH